MIVSLPKTLGIFGSVLGIGGIGTVGAYATTKKTIFDSLGEVRIVDKEKVGDEVWGKLKKKLEDSNGTAGKQKPKSKVFTDLQKKPSEADLKSACQKSGEKIYWTIFSKDSDLMDDVKSFCSITIEEVIESGKIFDVVNTDINNKDKGKYESNLDVLKSHETLEGKPKLDKDLTNLKTAVTTSSDKNKFWPDLLKWCSKSYKSYFLNKEEDLWKNTETYCKK